MGYFQQTKYLVRKNYQTKKRNKRETLQEILIPLWWMAMLFLIKLGVRTTELPAISDGEIPSSVISTSGSVNDKPKNNSVEPTVGYVTNDLTTACTVMDFVTNYSAGNGVAFVAFNSSDSIVEFYRKHSESMKVGLEFKKGKKQGLAYTIRVDPRSMPSPETKLTGQDKCHKMSTAFTDTRNCPANAYIKFGIATLQASVDAAITKVETNLPYYTVPNIRAKMMPKSRFTPSLEGFSTSVSIYMVIAFTPYVAVLLMNLVQEKENKLRELMRISGMSDAAYWFSWICTYAVIMLIAVLVLNVIAVPGGIFGKSNYAVMVILFYLYGLSLITFSMMLTPFFKNAKTAGFLATIITIIFGIVPLAAKDASSSVKWILSLLSPTAFNFGVSQAVNTVGGLQFSNLTTAGKFPAINAIVMLIVDTIVYFLLALYFDAVIPAEYGQRRPPYYIFMPSFWKSLFGGDKEIGFPERQLSDVVQEHSEDMEEVPAEMHGLKAVSIHKLRKVFHGKEDTVAVDSVSLDIYEGQVTALLGHNGAGKTTLIAMITGMVPPSGGSALVYGMEITNQNQMQKIRRIIGVCHQQNVLFGYLSVKEHLELYCGLKTITGEAVNSTVSSLIAEIDLKDQEDTLSKDLSGGQKRKLCVGISLIGDPKVVILDEPTSGMDPYSRRIMWSLLQEKCKDRVVLLTTHFMDEADILADYKAVLSKGKVRCAGTSLFLKNRFGIGYHLNMALADDCDTECLTDLIQSKVQGAAAIRQHGKEMAFALPMDQVSHFSELFRALEEHNNTSDGCTAPLIGVNSYGVSMTTLEEVFLQLESSNEKENDLASTAESGDTEERALELLPPDPILAFAVENGAANTSGSTNAMLTTGVELNNRHILQDTEEPNTKAKQQVLGLLKIRFLMTIRLPAKLIFMVLLPPVLLVVGLVISKTGTQSGPATFPQPLDISPELYLKPASSENYATQALIQNSTASAIDYIMDYFTAYKADTKLVSSISGVLSSSSRALWNLGFVIQQFPKKLNLSQSQIRFLMTIRLPAKLIFMVLLPPVLLVVGLVISKTGTQSGPATFPQPLDISPELYLKPASSENYATQALIQNSTASAIDYIMDYFTAYKADTKLVSSISGVLSSSSRALWNLGFVIQQFPKKLNLSQSQQKLESIFEMRYNDTTVHSIPLGVHMIGTVLHMNALTSEGKAPYPLETTILPFPKIQAELTYDNTAFISIMLIGMSLAIIPGGFAVEVVAQRQLKIRHLLRVSGVSSLVYWLQFFIADAVIFLMPVLLMLILIPALQLPSLSPAPAMGCLVLAVLLYLPSGILVSYTMSFLFSKWDTCQQVMPSVYNMGSFIPFLAVALIDMIGNSDTAIILHYVFVALIPPYPVFGALYYIDRVYRFAAIQALITSNGESVDVEVTASQYFTWTRWNGIPAALIAPVIHTILFGFLVYFLDQRDVSGSAQCSCMSKPRGNTVDLNRSFKRSSSFKVPEHRDEEVKLEKEMITAEPEDSSERTSFSVVVKGLWKRFKTKIVVKDLFFGVKRGEVFGLLGPNGAGKTTTLNIITADVHPTRGKVYVAGSDVSTHPFDAFQHMGFCPQVDALWEPITLEEHLEVFAKIRGVPTGKIKTLIDHYMFALKVAEHAKKRAKDLSGGTKRKVSFAMAMLGDPELLLLDEPSTGLDPSARRFLWNTISKNVRGYRGAILTTHSMEEADALCSRVGIMVKGQLKCLGSTQRLKSTYGSGYTLEIKLAPPQNSDTSTGEMMKRLQDYVKQLLPGATQVEVFGGRVTYKVPREYIIALSTIFDALERGKQVMGVEEYSFSQSTLEQVFLEFAKEQDEDRTGAEEPSTENSNTDTDNVYV